MCQSQLLNSFIITICLTACSSMEDDLLRAYKTNTITTFEEFIDKYPTSPYVKQAKERIDILWTTITPDGFHCEILSDLSINITWPSVDGAESYIIYWSTDSNTQMGHIHAHEEIRTEETSYGHKVTKDDYGDQMKIYYRFAGVRDGKNSKLSKVVSVRLLDDNEGTRCQICGKPAKGYCNMRHIYVCYDHNTFTDRSGTYWRCP